MRDIIKKEILEEEDSYLILHNGEIVEHSSLIDSLIIKKDIEFKIIHIIDQDTSINIDIAPDIKVKIQEVYYSVENNPVININFNIDKNAIVDFLSFKKTCKENLISVNVNTNLEENSYINNKNISIFSSSSNYHHKIYLNERNSKIDIKNVFINSSRKIQYFITDIYHKEKETHSDLKNYGICNNDSILNINSNGIIQKGAKQTELRQKAKGLILDLNSTISANPILEIGEYDCIANHGASIGAIDEDELYYLMSRGLSRQESEKLIVSGFIIPFLNEIKEGKFQDYLMSWININI